MAMPFDFSKSWFASSFASSSSSSSSSALRPGKETTSILNWVEQIEPENAAVASNVGLLCWTIYLAKHLSKRTTQEDDKSMMRQTRRGNIRGKSLSSISDKSGVIGSNNSDNENEDEQLDGEISSGEGHLRKSKPTTKYNLITHVWSLVGIKEGTACISVATLLCLRTFCDLRMIR